MLSFTISKRKFDLLILVFLLVSSTVFTLAFYDGKRPEGFIIKLSGLLAILLLSFTLGLSAFCNIFSSFRPLLIHRRHLGIATALVATVHATFTFLLHTQGDLSLLTMGSSPDSLATVPFLLWGFLALCILSLLAITSNQYSLNKLGKYWKTLHILIYPAYFFAVLHVMLGSFLTTEGLATIVYPLWAILFLMIGYAILKRQQEIPNTKETNQASNNGTTIDAYLSRFLSFEEEKAELSEEKTQTSSKNVVVDLDFVDGKEINGKSLQTILENSLEGGVDHIFECGGNARCSTCRVYIIEGLENCTPRTPAEQELAKKKGFEPHIRLACQTKAVGSIKLKRLVYDKEDILDAQIESSKNQNSSGKEMQLAVLFSDIRSFTPFTEANLPYDVVHMLNKYFNVIGQAIDDNHGFIDKYMGDGIMALFGLDEHRSEEVSPCVDATHAAIHMQEALAKINPYLEKYFHHEFQIGIGIHYGPVIVGNMGYPKKMQFTALGDSVNLAARIEAKTKELQAKILVSEHVQKGILSQGIEMGREFKSSIKGKTGEYCLYEVLGFAKSDPLK
ncbi:MAG: adenylate/guanylate cyclase domain-containing protein [Spirochaetota bacterium]